MKTRQFFFSLILNGFLIPFSLLGQEFMSGAKALFYDPATGAALKDNEKKKNPKNGQVAVKPVQPNKIKYVGLNYWIELEGGGRVTEDYTFRTGDGFRLHIRSNVNGFLSLWSVDSTGKTSPLFPSGGMDNSVAADTDYVPPGFIRFEPPVEDEQLLIFFSRNKADTPTFSKTSADLQQISRVTQGLQNSKALVFETEKKNAEEFGAYAVNVKGGVVMRLIRLKHRARD